MTSGVATQRAVILARGLGTRMRRGAGDDAPQSRCAEVATLAGKGLKGLIPVCGRPFLDYVIDSVLRAGVRRLCMVVAPQSDELRDYASRTAGLAGVEIVCAVQDEPRGTADAVLAAEEVVGDEPFLVVNSDNLYPGAALAGLAAQDGPECWTVAFDSAALGRDGDIAPERVRAFAVIVASDEGRLVDIVEKPPRPEDYVRDGKLWVGMNLYRFTPSIFQACRAIEPDPARGELELTSAVSLLAGHGAGSVRVKQCEETVLDLTSRADIAVLERLLAGRTPGF